ncbi:amidase family protein [Mesorhizobium sp. M1380]|uniref:amidase family protein n=1 Tax=Mesorhizobium sp. M1380 TaxID=2957093 RepID=UPI0033382EC9
MIRTREVSAVDVVTAYLDHIDLVNPHQRDHLASSEARSAARGPAADVAVSRGEKVGPLHGVPQAIKDLANTEGLRLAPFRDFIPDNDAIFVSRMRPAGAIIIGETNTPEFGLGSNSYNPIFGTTLTPMTRRGSAVVPAAGRPFRSPCGCCGCRWQRHRRIVA